MPPLTPSAIFIASHRVRIPALYFQSFGLQSLAFLGVLDPKFHKSFEQLFLSNASGLVVNTLDHRAAAALELTRAKSRKDDKTILAVDAVWDKNQAEPPKEAIISSIRTC